MAAICNSSMDANSNTHGRSNKCSTSASSTATATKVNVVPPTNHRTKASLERVLSCQRQSHRGQFCQSDQSGSRRYWKHTPVRSLKNRKSACFSFRSYSLLYTAISRLSTLMLNKTVATSSRTGAKTRCPASSVSSSKLPPSPMSKALKRFMSTAAAHFSSQSSWISTAATPKPKKTTALMSIISFMGKKDFSTQMIFLPTFLNGLHM
mmetsp:Transcript_62343/g.145100  ORF Transcript_62343/g.145100 Transcript_62343/m.145100 type:complete len:208 (+) Transcript_62343:502-1125(+)